MSIKNHSKASDYSSIFLQIKKKENNCFTNTVNASVWFLFEDSLRMATNRSHSKQTKSKGKHRHRFTHVDYEIVDFALCKFLLSTLSYCFIVLHIQMKVQSVEHWFPWLSYSYKISLCILSCFVLKCQIHLSHDSHLKS